MNEDDLKKIPRLERFFPGELESLVIKIADNLDKVPLDILGVFVSEILEVMGPPTKLPPCMALKLIGYVRTIVEWEAKFYSLGTELEKDL